MKTSEHQQDRATVFGRIGKQSKVERYEWVQQDEPGHLKMLEKASLLIDESYQRSADANEAKVLAMASAWSWVACGAIVVAERGGKHYVIDGGHRVCAARKRSDIVSLPCVVFKTKDRVEDATGYIAINTLRKPMAVYDKFRGLLAKKDPIALATHDLIVSGGRSASKSGSSTTVRCLAVIMYYIEKSPDILKRIWPLITAISDKKEIPEMLISGLAYIESNLDEGVSLTDKELSSRVRSVGQDGLITGAKKASAYYARGGAKVFAQGMLDELNKRRRTHITLAE